MANLREAGKLLLYYLLLFTLFRHFILLLLCPCRDEEQWFVTTAWNQHVLTCLNCPYNTEMRTASDRKHINNSLWSHCSPQVIWLVSSTAPLKDRDYFVLLVGRSPQWSQQEAEAGRMAKRWEERHIHLNLWNTTQEKCNHIMAE